MRWDGQLIDAPAADDGSLPGLPRLGSLIRSVQTPEFAGVTFHEVLARSALNRVPSAARVPFEWTINPYRGCTHACTYCFARNTHAYLELDVGEDFDSQIVVKINVAEVLKRELGRPSWQRQPVALGTNTDPYQRAEGRYQLMPRIIRSLRGAGTPFSILTKGATARRDLSLLAETARDVPVGMGVSIALDDEAIHRDLEPGTHSSVPADPGPGHHRSRAALPGARGTDPANDHRLRRAARPVARQDRRRRCHQRHRLRAPPAAGREGVVLALPRGPSFEPDPGLPRALPR
jgi:hypothetical protein